AIQFLVGQRHCRQEKVKLVLYHEALSLALGSRLPRAKPAASPAAYCSTVGQRIARGIAVRISPLPSTSTATSTVMLPRASEPFTGQRRAFASRPAKRPISAVTAGGRR